MKDNYSKLLISEFPHSGTTPFAKTWHYATCLLLVSILSISQTWAADVAYTAGKGGSTTLGDKVKIHTNTDEVTSIAKFANSILNNGNITNYWKITGDFKEGDVITFTGVYNNSEAKTTAIAIYDKDKNKLFTSAQCINGRTSNDDPAEETYTLTSDYDELYLGRDGSTGTFLLTFSITRESGSDPTPACEETDATFAATATEITIARGETEASTTLSFTKGDNTSDATFAVTKDGTATSDASVSAGTFTATVAGTYKVTATQEADGTYCEVVKEVTITVTDANVPDYLLIDQSTGTVNTTHFRTTSSASEKTYTVDGTAFAKYIQLGGTYTTPVGFYETNKVIAYDAKTNSVKVEAWVYNKASSTDYKFYISIIEEGGTEPTPTIYEYTATKNTGTKVSRTLSLSKNATIYLHVGNNSNLHICQVGITENGTALLQGGQIGYTINLGSSRFASNKTKLTMEGIEYNATSNAVKVLTSDNPLKLKATTEYVKFTLAAAEKVSIKATGTYSVTDSAAYDATKAISGDQDVVLTAGTWYISPNGSNVTFASLTFAAPPTMRTISFDSDGGSAVTAIQVADGTAATKPADPTWEHHRFDGWYNGETPYNWSANVTGDLTLTAHWTQLYTVTYAAGDGTATGDAPTQTDKAAGETFTVAANTFAVAGKDFLNWNDGTNDYDAGDTYTVGTANVVLTAQWKAAADKYTVIFKDGETTLDTKLFEVGQNPSDAEIDKTKPLSTFAAWQLSGSDIALNDAFWTTVAKDATVTLTARWTMFYAESIDLATEAAGDKTAISDFFAGKGYATTIGGNGAYDTNASGYLGYKFKNNGDEVQFNLKSGKIAEIAFMYIETSFTISVDGVETEVVTNKTTSTTPLVKYIYANGADKLVRLVNNSATGKTSVINKITIRDPYVVTYDANGGDDVAALYGTPSVTLPSATNGTQVFKGWYTAAEDGEKIGNAGDTYTPTAAITLYAQWESVSSDNTLSALEVDGASVEGFDPDTHIYYLVYDYGQQPTITSATATDAAAGATVAISNTPVHYVDADNDFWYVQANVTPASGTPIGYYQVRYTNLPKQGVELIKATHIGAKTATVTGYIGGTYDKNTQDGSKLGADGHYFGIQLAEGKFQAGDMLIIKASTLNGGNTATLYSDKGTTEIKVDGTFDTSSKMYIYVLEDEVQKIYLYRKTSACNPNVEYMAVYRDMDPVIASLKIGEAEATINEAASPKTIDIELPYGTDISSITPVIEAYANGGATVTPMGAQDFSEGAIDYTVTSLYSETTTYKVTISVAAPSENAYLSSLTVAGYALDFDKEVTSYDLVLDYGTAALPEIAYTLEDDEATAVKVEDGVNGATTITVTPVAGAEYKKVYTINFSVSTSPKFVIYDGSKMTDIATSGADLSSGFEWSLIEPSGTSGTNSSISFEGKAYSKCVNVFTSATKASENKRYFAINIPNGYLAKFRLVGGSNGSDERSLFVSKTITDQLDESIAYATSESNSTAGGMTSDYQNPGTYYLCATKSIRLYEFSVTLYPAYTRSGLSVGSIGTFCPEKSVLIYRGVSFYELGGGIGSTAGSGSAAHPSMLIFNEVDNLIAGMPYLFIAEEEAMGVVYEGDAVLSAGHYNGFHGTLSQIDATADNILVGKYAVVGTEIRKLGGWCQLPANRAYFDLNDDDFKTYLTKEECYAAPGASGTPNPAPNRRRVTLNNTEANQTTAIEYLTEDGVVGKAAAGCYDVLGRRISEPQDGGVYILNGKKVVIVK